MKNFVWHRQAPSDLDRYARRPVFIVGSPRSGTTVMRYIIDAHPKIFCPHLETFYFDVMNRIFNGHIWAPQYGKSNFDRQDYVAWQRDAFLTLMANYGEVANKTRFCEKTPSHSQVMGLIKEVFPDAQFIHMIRNGADVCGSLGRMSWGPNAVDEQARLWVERVTAARQSGRLMGDEDYIEIKLEELKRNFVPTLRNLCEFLGEKYHDQMQEFHLADVNSWGIELPHFDRTQVASRPPWTPEDSERFKEVAGELMRELRYELPIQ